MPFGLWVQMGEGSMLDGVHSDATWRIPLNRPCAAANASDATCCQITLTTGNRLLQTASGRNLHSLNHFTQFKQNPRDDWQFIQLFEIILQELIRRWDSERELFYFYDDIIHVEASAYAHWTDLLISTINIYGRPIYAHKQSSMHLSPSNRVISLFCPNNRWIIARIVLIWS